MKLEDSVVDQFTEKYESSGKIGDLIINNFYTNLQRLYKQIESEISNIHEVACGPGFSTYRIWEFAQNKKITASDFEKDLVKVAGKRVADVKFHQESIYKIDKKHDLIFALEVLEHLENPEKAVKEISNKINKYAIISVPREPIWRVMNLARLKYISGLGNTPGHVNHWGAGGFSSLLEKHFEIIDKKTPLPWQMYLVKKK